MTTTPAAVSHEQIVSDLAADERVRRAFRFFEERAEEITEEHAAVCSIPAPPPTCRS